MVVATYIGSLYASTDPTSLIEALGSLPPEVKAAVDSVEKGQVSGVIESAGSLTILRVNDRRPQKQMSFDEVKDKLRAQLEEATRQDRFQTLDKHLRKGARIEIL